MCPPPVRTYCYIDVLLCFGVALNLVKIGEPPTLRFERFPPRENRFCSNNPPPRCPHIPQPRQVVAHSPTSSTQGATCRAPPDAAVLCSCSSRCSLIFSIIPHRATPAPTPTTALLTPSSRLIHRRPCPPPRTSLAPARTPRPARTTPPPFPSRRRPTRISLTRISLSVPSLPSLSLSLPNLPSLSIPYLALATIQGKPLHQLSRRTSTMRTRLRW